MCRGTSACGQQDACHRLAVRFRSEGAAIVRPTRRRFAVEGCGAGAGLLGHPLADGGAGGLGKSPQLAARGDFPIGGRRGQPHLRSKVRARESRDHRCRAHTR